MTRRLLVVLVLIVSIEISLWAAAAETQAGDVAQELAALRTEIERLRGEYAEQIVRLETQLEALQLQMLRASAEATPAPAAPSQPQVTYNALNPSIAVIGNFLGRADAQKVFNEDGVRIDNSFNLRETELDFRLPVDPYADAVFIAAFESETPGEFETGVEEGYVNIKQLPFLSSSPLGLKFQVGRFRPAFGRFNLLHTHALPQSTRSLPTEEFLGEEGFIQQGISTDFFIPSPSETDSLNARLQVLGGGSIAVSPESRSRLAYVGNLRWFRTIGDAHSTDIGWSSYWHPGNDHGSIVRLHGVDFTYAWKPLRQRESRSFLAGGEFLFTDPRASSTGQDRPFGTSLYTQWQLDRRKYVGVRWDYTEALEDVSLERRSLTPYLSYYFSEFLRFRVNYEHRWSDIVEEDGRDTVFMELNWIFGAHPPEPFWVNR